MQLVKRSGGWKKKQPYLGFLSLACPWLLELCGPRKSNFSYPSPNQLPSVITQTFWVCPSQLDPLMCLSPIFIPKYFLRTLMLRLSSLFPVMHESSKKVSETLQEIYSSEWDGHEDLKAIVGVSVLGLTTPHTSLLPSFQPHLSFFIQANRKTREPTHIAHLYSLRHGWKRKTATMKVKTSLP